MGESGGIAAHNPRHLPSNPVQKLPSSRTSLEVLWSLLTTNHGVLEFICQLPGTLQVPGPQVVSAVSDHASFHYTHGQRDGNSAATGKARESRISSDLFSHSQRSPAAPSSASALILHWLMLSRLLSAMGIPLFQMVLLIPPRFRLPLQMISTLHRRTRSPVSLQVRHSVWPPADHGSR